MGKNIADINNFLQFKMRKEDLTEVPLRIAAKWLHEYDYLKDSKTSPGFPLRRLAKARLIIGAEQRNNYYWYITRQENYRELMSIYEVRKILGIQTLNSLYMKLKKNAIPHVRLNGKRVVFYREEILNWLVQNNFEESLDLNGVHETVEALSLLKSEV